MRIELYSSSVIRNRNSVPAVLAIAVLASSCVRYGPLHHGNWISIRPEPLLFAPGEVYGYSAIMREPTKAFLTIQRTGEKDALLEHEYNPGEKAAFGYAITTFKTRSGQDEHKFQARLRFIRTTETGEFYGGYTHEFFLGSPKLDGGETLVDDLRFGETLEFAHFKCGETGTTIRLSIRFEKLACKENREYPHFTDVEIQSPWVTGDEEYAKDGGSIGYSLQVPATNSHFRIVFCYGDWEAKRHWSHAKKYEHTGSCHELARREVEMVLRKLYETKGSKFAATPFFYWNNGRGRTDSEVSEFRNGSVPVDFPPEWKDSSGGVRDSP